ncbi:MAG: glycosyl hydrolase [Chloroflexi bacterium]|nr:glycosyl hydrolase [Chloroflexota bacterium]
MTFCVSIGGQNQYRGDAPSNEILVGTLRGFVKLKRSGPGSAWEEDGRALTDMHVSTLLIEPTRGRILAGSHGNGIHASEDGGRNWKRVDSGIESPNVFAMNWVQDGDKVKVYAGTEPAYLYVSEDLGESWTELPSLRDLQGRDKWYFPGPPHIAHVKTITFDPRVPSTIYLGVEVGGGFKSTDSGKTWKQLEGFFEDVHRLVVTAKRPNDVYMSTGDGVYHSSNGGEVWEHQSGRDARIAYPDGLVIHPEQPELLFTSGSITDPGHWRETHDADARIGRSGDGGKTWEYLDGGLPAHIQGNIEALSLSVYPGGYQLASATTNGEVFYSEDGGSTWQTIATGLPAVSKGGHYMALQPAGAR